MGNDASIKGFMYINNCFQIAEETYLFAHKKKNSQICNNAITRLYNDHVETCNVNYGTLTTHKMCRKTRSTVVRQSLHPFSIQVGISNKIF